MDEATTTASPPEPFFLLWLLAAGVAVLASHVALGFTREARRQSSLPTHTWRLAAAVLALGSGTWAAMALGIASQALAYTVGFGAPALAAAWATALAAAALPLVLMSWRPSMLAAWAGGAWFGALASLAQALMLLATGPAPGLAWQPLAAGMAVLVCTGACTWAHWIAHLGAGRAGRHRRRWRWLAAAVLGAGLMAGQELVQVAGDLATQVASAQAFNVSMATLTLWAAVAAPALLGALAAVLHLGRAVGGDEDSTLARPSAPPRRRKRGRRSLWRRLFP